MHAKFKRRIDHAERAVARKRRQLTGPITITVVRTIIPASTSTSSIPSTSSTTTSSFSSSSTSISSSTTSPAITATSTTLLPPITLSASTSFLPTSTISSSASPSTTIEPVAGSASSSSRLSFGAIVGVVIGCVVALIIAIFLCTLCTRKRYQRDRARLRSLWASKDPGPGIPGIMGGFEPKPYMFTPNEQTAQVNPSTLGSVPVPVVPIVQVAPPPASYSNATLSASPAVSNLPVYSQGTQLSSPFSTTVVCTFLPSLPDELSINIGDTIRVLAEYDDGWALCMSMNGEQGMVPLECLDQQAGSFRSSGGSGFTAGGLGVPQDREVRRSRRVSSLDPNAKALKAYQ